MLANLNRYKIVLASNSPRRKELMTGLGVDYVVKTLPDVDESYPDSLQGEEIPLFIAREKAAAYQSVMHPEELLITADTIVWHEGKALGKPSGREDAIEMLRNISFSQHLMKTKLFIMSITISQWTKPVRMACRSGSVLSGLNPFPAVTSM